MKAPAPDQVSVFSPEEQAQLAAWLSHPDSHMELLGGHLVSKFPPGADLGGETLAKGKHGAAQGAIFAQLGPPDLTGRWWLTQDPDLYIGGQGMRPDVAGWRLDSQRSPPPEVNVGEHLGVVIVPPDWVCEVLSPSTTVRDRGVKWKAYHRASVKWYWIVDVASRTLTVYERTPRSYEVAEMAGPGDVARLPPFESVAFQVAPLFAYGAPPLPRALP